MHFTTLRDANKNHKWRDQDTVRIPVQAELDPVDSEKN